VIIFPAVGLTFDQIAKAIGRNEVWLAAAFYGQVRNFQTLAQYIISYGSGKIYHRRTR
jgi:cyanate lyase